jgi:psp operon transcriptional activator
LRLFCGKIYHMKDEQEDTLTTNPDLPEALGQSEAFLDFQDQLSRVAPVDRPVLIMGERGTGKELAARRLHFLSRRWQEPLVELNCAALAPGLIESELFGHESGAFTGAAGRRTGRFEAADGGTLFLDELGNIPLQVQEKILRVVEYGAFERVGGSRSIQADVRIAGATNADLPRRCEEGTFMRDLLDRLSFEVLYLPPLRERSEDIPLLARHFAARMAFELGRAEMPDFSNAVLRQLCAWPWRGNVRELKNVVERAVYRAESATIKEIIFDPFPACHGFSMPDSSAARKAVSPGVSRESLPETASGPFETAVRNFEIALLRKALADTRYNQREAAERLHLTYHQFRGLYRKYRQDLAPEAREH